MNHTKLFIAITFTLVDLFLNCARAHGAPANGAKAEVEVVELRLQDQRGLKLEIFKRKPGKSKSSSKNPPPDFPVDLIVSGDIQERGKTWFPWNPQGTNNYHADNSCRQEAVRDLIWQNTSVAAQGRALNDWVARCNHQLAHGILRSSYIPLIRQATVDYDFLDNRNIHHVKATLSDGRVLDGFVAMKPDRIPRPFVIAKCGVFCNAEQSVMHRSFMMHLFDESPFHVLSLANNTGSDFQINNQALSVGGFDEGRQLYQIAQLVKSPDSPIQDRISSVHILGASLGGNAALYAGLYSAQNDPPGQDAIQSVTAVCPVVVLENTIRDLYSIKPISTVAAFETIHQLRDVFNFVPVIGRFFSINPGRIRANELYDKLTQAILNYYKDWTREFYWDLKPFQGVRVRSLSQFWELNDFRKYVSQVTVPTLVISANNDELVKTPRNSRLLSATLNKTPNRNISSIFLRQGNHCAFAIGNGWGNYSMILREYILSHSPEARKYWHRWDRELATPAWDLRGSELIVETVWSATLDDEKMLLKMKIFNPQLRLSNLDCKSQKPTRANVQCYRSVEYRVPIRSLPLEDIGTPRNPFEVTSLTRLANTRFSVVDEQGELVVNSRRRPRFVRGWGWNYGPGLGRGLERDF